jgi:DNA-binding winged helix-turn-helix (wHTH) protein
MAPARAATAVRLALIDDDSGLETVLQRRLRAVGWEATSLGYAAASEELAALRLLAAADGRVLEREDIYQRVWGYTMARGDRSVDVFVRKLRHKLDAVSPGWRYVHTHFGVGYRFAAEPVEGARVQSQRPASATRRTLVV